jgi:hypothetical protein
MSSSEEYGTGLPGMYGASEPMNVGFFIDKTWYLCWPKVIARAWTYQITEEKKSTSDDKYENKALLIESGQRVTMASPDDRWYMDLLSHDPYRTKKALEAEGMTFMASAKAAEEDWQKWIFTKMIVRSRSQTVDLTINSEANNSNAKYSCKKDDGYSQYERSMPWDDVSQGLGHFLVLTLPPAPSETKLIGQALADYKATNKIYPLS